MLKQILSTVIIVVVQLALPVTVFADDPPPPAAEESNPPESASGEETATPEDVTVAEALDQIPQDTQVIVINEASEAEPLATEQAAQIIAEADPMWCPAAATTVTAECVNDTTVSGLLAQLAGKDEAGVIYFTATYTTNDATFDGTNTDIDQLADDSLSLQGGWDGNTSLNSTITYSGATTFDGVALEVINWTGAVSLHEIVVDGAAETGITVLTTGDIYLENIESSNNTGVNSDGAYLDNELGNPANPGSVTLAGTNVFNNNDDFGLAVESNRSITTNNLTANGNGDRGVDLHNSLYNYTMTIGGNNVFNNNGNWGLAVFNRSDIVASNITANDNGHSGAAFETHDPVTAPLIITGTNVFNGNALNGLSILSHVQVYVENVTASGNGEAGAIILDIGTLDVTLAGTNAFNDNGDRGLRIHNRGGDVTLNNITASGNTLEGVYVQAFDSGGPSPVTTLTVTGTNVFDDNGLHGLLAYGGTLRGAITLENVTATDNGGSGLSLDNTGSATNAGISLTGTNVFAGNTAGGLAILSNGDVDLYGVSTDDNSTGASIDTAEDVTITCGSFANETTGLSVDSASLTLNGVTFSGNATDVSSTSTPVITLLDCNPFSGKTVVNVASKPVNELLSAGGPVALDCEQYRGTQLRLSNGDFVYFPCPIQDTASLGVLAAADLPGDLPEEHTHQSALMTTVTENGEAQETVEKFMTISFSLPAGVEIPSLAILFWDGSQWAEQDAFLSPDGTHLQASVDFTGSFALVSR